MSIGQNLYKKAKKIIPGGTQLLSKRPEMFLPDYWPSYYAKAKGIKITDLDGKTYIDMSYMGIGANVLGYCDRDVDKAVLDAIKNGNMSTLNAPQEVELAELMLELHPWSEMVRYSKSGGEAMSIAIRIARAATGKDVVLFSGYHGWHDWYLSANIAEDKALDGHLLQGLKPAGVPRSLAKTSIPFYYNDLNNFKKIVDEYDGKIAAVVMEPIRGEKPKPGFFENIRKVTKEKGIVLIIDEVSAGFRLCCGGAHLKLELEPDMATFAKGMSNGYPQGMIIGRRDVMEAAQDTFISSTYWTERIGLAASIATIKKYRENQVHEHLEKIGKLVQTGWRQAAKEHQIDIEVGGIYPFSHFDFKYKNPLAYKTYFTQELLDHGILATTSCYTSYAHTEKDVDKYIKAVNEVFKKINRIHTNGQNIDKYLKGEICHSGFQRLTK